MYSSAKAVRIQTNVGATRRVAPKDLGLLGATQGSPPTSDTQVAPYQSDGNRSVYLVSPSEVGFSQMVSPCSTTSI
jgi:hypothetical protein